MTIYLNMGQVVTLLLLLVFSRTLAVGANEKHPCDRICVPEGPAMDCHFTFIVELYNSLSKVRESAGRIRVSISYYVYVSRIIYYEHRCPFLQACFDCPLNVTDCHRPHCVPADGVEKGIVTINRWGRDQAEY